MAWIESHQTLDKNGKLLELANKLGINKYQAIGHLHALWWWALDNAENGNLKRFSNATVTQACGWTDYIKDETEISRINEFTNRDKAGIFVDVLIECGFLDKKSDGIWVHNWDIYTHRYFASVTKNKKNRELTNKRVRNYRQRNASVTLKKRDVTLPTVPNHTLPNLTVPNITNKDLKTISPNGDNQNHVKTQKEESKLPTHKDREYTDLQKVVLAYKIVSGYPKEDKSWDKANFPRCAKTAKTLLEFLGGWEDSCDCIQEVYESFTGKNLTVTIETILKHAADWKRNKEDGVKKWNST